MIGSRQRPALRNWLLVVLAAGQFGAFPLAAETVPPVPAPQKLFSAPANLLLPPVPHSKSPVDLFRELLAMTPAEREKLPDEPAAGNPRPHSRQGARIRGARPERARIAPARHRIALVFAAPPARIADEPRRAAGGHSGRFAAAGAKPPPAMEHSAAADAGGISGERAHPALFHARGSVKQPAGAAPARPDRADLAHWNTLSEDQRQKITAQFNQFFELTPVEKQKTLNTLSDAERRQMEKTLQTFDKLPPAQRPNASARSRNLPA